jgi:hypothetical protein
VWIPGGVFAAAALWCAWRAVSDCGSAAADLRRAVDHASDG